MSKVIEEVSAEETEKQYEFAAMVRESFAGKKCLVHSYGCQQNVSDGEKIKGWLKEMGGEFTDEVKEADFIIFNTCAVRENAEDRVFGNVGALKKRKEEAPGTVIALCGCMTQQPRVVEKLKKSYPYVDMVFGSHSIYKLPELLFKKIQSGKRVFEYTESDVDIAEGTPISRDGDVRAWLPVMYGCNNFCTYCIVPYVRGRERSRRSENIIREAEEIARAGYKEITLLGQNVNSYGKGMENELDFSDLLKKIDAIEGDFRIRFMTSHPKDCTKKLIDTIAQSKKICHHIHLPVQSGSDEVLRRMNRNYTAAKYCELIDYARSVMPDVTFTSDIIVGFPGETRADFEKTVELIKRVRFSGIFTFIYSKREGSAAAKYDDPVPYKEKSDWLRELLAVQEDIGVELREKLLGKTVRVLFDSEGKNEGYITGRDGENNIIVAKAPDEFIGEFADVKLTAALNWAIEGEIIK